MTTWASNFNVRWVLLPFAYAMICAPVLLVGVFLAISIERALGNTLTYGFTLFATLFSVGTPVFALLAIGLSRLERLERPRLLDHLRHCAFVYAGMLVLVITLLASYNTLGGSLGYGLGVCLLFVTVNAVFSDALILYAKRRRFSTGSS